MLENVQRLHVGHHIVLTFDGQGTGNGPRIQVTQVVDVAKDPEDLNG